MTLWKNLVVALVAAFALAACSSSDNGTDTSMPTDPPPTQAEQDLEALQDQIAALRKQLGIDDDDDNADIGTTITELQATLRDLQKQVDDAAADADAAAKKAAAADAEALFTGLDTDRPATGTADLAVTSIMVSDSHGGFAKVIASVDVDGVGSTTLETKVREDTAEPMLDMWKGTEVFVNPEGTMSTNTVVVYTDVGPNSQKAFDAVYADTNADGDLTMGPNAATSAASYVPLISAPAFTHAGQKDHAPKATAADNVIVRLPGTFHGAAGQYTCTAASANECVSHEDDNGIRLTVGGSAIWEFVPGPNAMVSVKDDTYLYFGWWLHESSAGPEAVAFHGVTEPSASTEAITTLSGTATYSGAAAGKYAIDPIAPGTYASGGHWTADASLTADFGTEATEGTITGTIDGFMTDNGDEKWRVSLGETNLLAAGTFDSAANDPATGVVWTIDGEAAPEAGAWSGALHGQTPPPDGNNVPSGVTGQFSAVYSEGGHNIGHMVGAFGAHVDD